MPHCSVCALPAIASVNRALVLGAEPIAALARRHSVSRQALLRHQAKHLPEALLAAKAEGGSSVLLGEIQGLKDHVQELLLQSKQKGDTRGAVTAIREGTRLIELIGRMEGALTPTPSIQINLHQTVEFQTVAARIIGALDQHPEAKASVIAALQVVH